MTEPCDLTAVEARRLMGERKLSPVELLESCLSRIEKTNKAVNAIVAMDVDVARKRARELEQAGRGGAEHETGHKGERRVPERGEDEA